MMKLVYPIKCWLPFLLCAITVSACHIENRKLLLINSTNKHYYYRLSPDTFLKEGNSPYDIAANDSVRPLFVRGGDGAWEYFINEYSPDHALHIFLFTDSAVTDDIITHQKFKRLDYKIADLNKLKWEVRITK